MPHQGACRDQFENRAHRPSSRPLDPDHWHRARARNRSGSHSRAVGGRGRHEGRQPVLSRRPRQGRSGARATQGPHRHGRGQAQAAPRAARVHDRDVRRHPQRHARDALFADRARSHQRHAVRAPERDRPLRHHRHRRLRQAAGRHAGGAARAQSAGDHHVGRLDPSGPRSEDGRDHRSRHGLPGRGPSRRRLPPSHRLPCLPGLRQLRRHVHVQHHADLHRRRRHAAAADGGAAVRRPAPGGRVRRPAGRAPRQSHRQGHQAARHRRARFTAQCRDRRDGNRRLDQRDAARPGDRAGGGICRLLEGGHDA